MKIPEDWDKVTLERWAALENTKEEKPKTEKEKITRTIKRVSILLDCEMDEARKFPYDDLIQVDRLFNVDKPTKLYKRFILNGIRYKVITKPHKLSTGEVEELVADAAIMKTGEVIPAINTRGRPERVHQALFAICKPLRRKRFLGITYKWEQYEFESYEVKDRIEDFKQLTLDIANPIAVFFSRLSKGYSNHILDSLANQMEIQKKKVQQSEKDLESVGVGSSQ